MVLDLTSDLGSAPSESLVSASLSLFLKGRTVVPASEGALRVPVAWAWQPAAPPVGIFSVA